MTERLLTETRISFTQLAQEQDVSIPTVWRWSQRGVRGHVLESFSLGIRKYTTREAFQRWVSLTNGERVSARSSKQRAADHSRAKAALSAAGIS